MYWAAKIVILKDMDDNVFETCYLITIHTGPLGGFFVPFFFSRVGNCYTYLYNTKKYKITLIFSVVRHV